MPAEACTDLSLAKGPFIGGGMGESAILLTLTNRGQKRCEVHGYPKVDLLTKAGRALPFAYTREHNQFMTTRPPQFVYLLPGERAYVQLVTYSCDVGRGVAATEIRLRPPGTTRWLSVSRRSGAYTGYCSQFAPGQSMAVSPVEATARETVPS